ncbi:MAG TPA: LuxR C-terminal-related transcriptional regulator [Anaerolineales bacterium]|nr:LuxR C-terminal-related transcriptional regulator [Anaerolineales bacterium]
MALRTNIPIELTSFIGRNREIAEVLGLLTSSRLVTLTGAAGCGKTRLALRIAVEISRQFHDGVHWIDLARLIHPNLVPQTVARALNISEQTERPLEEALLDALQDKKLLLVLDNCEHLLSACRHLVESLLLAPAVSILATSRERLGCTGEMLYPVAPLSLPPRTLLADDVKGMGQFDAIKLFVERARTILPAFELTEDNASAVARICQQLDGIPLAIELASARLNVLAAAQIAARLDNLFALLPSATHVAHSHHRSLRAAIEWSHDLLSEPEQILLRRLSVFAGGCSLATGETVCAGEGVEREQVLELLSSLVNKSLVVADTLQRGEARYALLETIRQYGQEKLIDSGEWTVIRDRHLQCYLKLSEETDPKLRGEYQRLWLNWLDTEYDNIRAALAWAVEGGRQESSRVSAGLRIATSLYQYWRIRDYVEEGLNWCRQLFALANDEISPVVRANALVYASLLAGIRGQIEDQMRYAEEAVLLGEAAGGEGKKALAMALGAQGYAARKMGDYQTAFNLVMREIQLLREVGEPYMLSVSLSLNSFAAMSIGKYEQARAMLDEALPLLREAGDLYRIAMALNYAGDLARCERNYQQAQTAYEESISLLRKIGAIRDLASALHNLGHACLHLGDVERAKALFSESMALHQEQGNRQGMTECLLGFAALAITAGLPAAGARLLAAAAAIGGWHVTFEWAATRMEYEHYLERAQASLVETAYQAEQAAGQRMSLEQAVAYAQDLAQKAAAAGQIRRQLDQLTPRECEIAVLIAQAKTNAEIAAELVLSKRTVESHIANIRSKLGFTERAQIVRWAFESGLVKASE